MKKDIYKLKQDLALVGISRGKYKLIEPSKWSGLVMLYHRFSEIKPFFKAVSPHIDAMDAMFLFGSRVSGDYSRDSDYDFLVFTHDDAAIAQIKEIKKEHPQISLELHHTMDLDTFVEKSPIFAIAATSTAVAPFGEALKWHIFSKGLDSELVVKNLRTALKRTRQARKLLEGRITNGDISAVIYVAFLRWRESYYARTLLGGAMPPMLDEFSEHWGDGRRLRELYQFYRVVRDMDPEEVPKEVPKIGKQELKKLLDIVENYVKETKKLVSASSF